jgi:hypothetical protein
MPATKTRSYIKYENTSGVLIKEYPEYLIDVMTKQSHDTVSAIIFGHDGSDFMLVHFEPLTDEQLSSTEFWQRDFDICAEVYASRINDLAAAAELRWPDVRIFIVPGCLCCNGIEDLREYDCEL